MFVERIQKAKKILSQKKVSFFLIEDPCWGYYFTGCSLSSFQLYITPKRAFLFVDGRYQEAVKKRWKNEKDFCIFPYEEKEIKKMFFGESDLLKKADKKKTICVGIDSATTTVVSCDKFSRFLQKIAKEKKLKMCLKKQKNPFKEIRAIKDKQEIKFLQKAATLAWKGLCFAKRHIQESMTEKELAREIEIFCIKNGADNMSFKTIVAFGKNGSEPHHEPDDTKVKKGDWVLIDMGVEIDHYCSDLTRCFCFGKEDKKFTYFYSLIKKAEHAAREKAKEGVLLKNLDREARKVLAKEGYEEAFLHSLGHGVGLEVHEFPRIKKEGVDTEVVLKKNMVITLEPGVYFPKLGGLRFENLYFITEKGAECFYPKDEDATD
jgi:Xaa-Pro aminopeptidase